MMVALYALAWIVSPRSVRCCSRCRLCTARSGTIDWRFLRVLCGAWVFFLAELIGVARILVVLNHASVFDTLLPVDLTWPAHNMRLR